jgi:prepilin signal peptidase PulO-like enzyme (type II secretory pathway)
MIFFIGATYFVLGTIIGSFLNVVALRYNTGRSVSGRSACFSCGKTLKWHELIPVFSFVFQLGRCGNCGSKLSWQYPIIEFFTGLIFLGIFLKFSPSYPIPYALYLMLIFSVLIVILIYDFRHKIIPNGLVYSFIILSFFSLFLEFDKIRIITPSFYDTLAGPILALPFLLLWIMSRGRWIGLGDAKLAAGIGWFLGLSSGVSAITFAFWMGALVGITALFLAGKTSTIKSEIPFGPFLIIGLFLVFFFNINIISFLSL